MKDPRDIIRRPIVSEKSNTLMEQNKYTFEVDIRANKVEVRQAVEKIFGVQVKSVSTIRVLGKKKRQGRYTGKTPERKKAVVTLTEESKPIDIYES